MKHRKLSASAKPANDTHPATRRARSTRNPRVMRVELVSVAQGTQTVVGVRSLRTGRVLFACVSMDARGAELAMLAAERYCIERSYVLVMPGSAARADKRKAA